jgi:hypothetical protein
MHMHAIVQDTGGAYCSFSFIIFRKLFQLLFFDIRSVTKNISFCLEVSEVPSCSILIQY